MAKRVYNNSIIARRSGISVKHLEFFYGGVGLIMIACGVAIFIAVLGAVFS
jgi:hypothetical protein